MHKVSIQTATNTTQTIAWSCTCGTGRRTASLMNAGAEANMHLRDAEEGLLEAKTA